MDIVESYMRLLIYNILIQILEKNIKVCLFCGVEDEFYDLVKINC